MGMWEGTAVSRLPVSGIYAPETADFRLTPVKTERRTRERLAGDCFHRYNALIKEFPQIRSLFPIFLPRQRPCEQQGCESA